MVRFLVMSTSETSTTSASRRQFIKYGVAGVVGFGVASAIEIPILENQISGDTNTIKQKNDQISTLQSQNTILQDQLNTAQQQQGFLTLNPTERTLVEAIAEAIIPSDVSGPGAKEAGAVYFIDGRLAGNYGKNGNMYMQGPFILPQSTAVTVTGSIYPDSTKQQITYSGGTIAPRLQAGTAYQYAYPMREFWRRGLVYLQQYANSAYGGNFETLSSSQQIQLLQDLFDNKDAAKAVFAGPTPAEFFNELYDMSVAGFWADPLYGGNRGMVGWQHLGSNGVNNGKAQNYTTIQLATSDHPIPIPPISLSQLQRGAPM